jgi:cysteine dioxygenase
MSSPLDVLFEYLNGLAGRAPLDRLVAALAQCDVDPDELEQFVRFSDRHYQRVPVRRGDWYQAWVMCWKSGQRSAIHDHKGSSCAVRVLRGTLTETLFDFAPNGHVKPTFSRDVLPGQTLSGEDTDVHQVSNLQADEGELVTLHVYSPPLAHMGTYDLTSNRRGLEPMMMEFSDAAGI